MIKPHKYRFGVNGNPLKSFFGKRKVKEKRTFPEHCSDTWDYVARYFSMNNYFVEVDCGKRESY
jgi:hypothetical protein